MSDDSKQPGEEQANPTFDPRSNSTSKELNFPSEIKRLLLLLNLGENTHSTPPIQAHFIDTIKSSHYTMKILANETRLPIQYQE